VTNDPFLSHAREERHEEKAPLFPRPNGTSKTGKRIAAIDTKSFLYPTSGCIMIQTAVSAAVLFMCFDETGHRNGYEEGHLDPEDQHSGCQDLFWWLLVQACCDLLITASTCILMLLPIKSDPISFHGCVAALRLCILPAGFHILYFSGLKRDLCDQPLILWSTLIIWLSIGMMAVLACNLLCILVGFSKKHTRTRSLQFGPRFSSDSEKQRLMHTQEITYSST
jgi:hypothetical protein